MMFLKQYSLQQLKPARSLVFLFFLTAYSLFARDITVTVIDADFGPLEGAVVHTWDNRAITCDETGAAVFQAPDDIPVSARITYPGYRTERISIIPGGQSRLTVSLRIEGLLENRELVFTAEKQNEGAAVQAGRSVTIAGKELARTSEIGIVEDVMTSVKLLPGVGYSGMFNARPSIRGSDPGDLVAVLDGFYVENPYYWGGALSIFDPRMLQSIKLSHGIFSSRYGYTTSGLLELSSKKPSEAETSLELGISSSAANLNVSLPFKNGGIMLMGRATYWDGYIALVKGLSYFIEELEPVRSVETAPYIRSAAIAGNYRLTDNTELNFNGFIGGDGVGARYDNPVEVDGRTQEIDMKFLWNSLRGFLISGINTTPTPSTVLKATVGGGFSGNFMDGDIYNNLFLDLSPDAQKWLEEQGGDPALMLTPYPVESRRIMKVDNTTWMAQGRFDFDWDMGNGFLFAAGAQEFYDKWTRYISTAGPSDIKPPPSSPLSSLAPPDSYINIEIPVTIEGANQALFSSAYTLLEYKSPLRTFGAELGLRVDHLYFIGEDFTIQTMPAFNPRLNIDVTLLRNKGAVDSLDITAGSGLFSSLTDNITALNRSAGLGDFDVKQNRSWTSLIGFKIGFLDNISFNIEGYYKYVFDRHYTLSMTDTSEINPTSKTEYKFDGEGRVWGFDLMLQRQESKFWDGWISYTFTYARYKNPWRVVDGEYAEGIWRYPNFHRFHNLNAVVNIKPSKRFNISARLGFASGTPLSVPGTIEPYPVLVVRDGKSPYLIQKYKRTSEYSDERRNGFALPLDIKLSYYKFTKEGKTQGEVYIAAENILSFLKTRVQNKSFNDYTGTEVEGSDTATYQMPVPMVSFGFSWNY